MSYIILELFPTPTIVTNLDGEVWITKDIDLAIDLKENCQCGFIVSIPSHLISESQWIAKH